MPVLHLFISKRQSRPQSDLDLFTLMLMRKGIIGAPLMRKSLCQMLKSADLLDGLLFLVKRKRIPRIVDQILENSTFLKKCHLGFRDCAKKKNVNKRHSPC